MIDRPPRHSKHSKHDTLGQRSSARMDSSERRTLIVMTNGIGMKSQDCLAFAVRHLLRSNDALILLHFDMAQKTTEYKHVGVMSDEAAALDEKMRVLKNRSATEHIQSLVEFCASNNIPVEVREKKMVDLNQVIHDLGCSPHHIVVIGSSHKSATERIMQGSMCDFVIHNCPLPIVIVKHPCTLTNTPIAERRIGLAVDDSEASLAAFNWVCDNFLRRAKAGENEPSGADKLYLIHIICEKQHNHSRGGAVVMDTYSDLCEARELSYNTINVQSCQAVDALRTIQACMDLKIVVIGCRQKSTCCRVLFGSVCDSSVRECDCDLVVIKVPAASATTTAAEANEDASCGVLCSAARVPDDTGTTPHTGSHKDRAAPGQAWPLTPRSARRQLAGLRRPNPLDPPLGTSISHEQGQRDR